jgi:hypothetical protein
MLLQLATALEVFSLPDQCWEQKRTKGKPPLGLYNNAYTVIGESLPVVQPLWLLIDNCQLANQSDLS